MSALMSRDPEFIKVEKQGNKQFYGLRGVHNPEDINSEFIGDQGNMEGEQWWNK